MRDNMTKRERVEFLLDHWCDFWETLERSETMRGDPGESLSLMPAMSRHPSVVELVWAITETRKVMPHQTAHMMAYYTAEWRNTTQPMKRRTKKGKVEVVNVRVRQRVLPMWIELPKVYAAVHVVTEVFRGEVFVPSELLDLAA